MRCLRFIVLLLVACPAVAQKYAPLPKPITDGKTVFILNETGAPETADRAYKELRSWGRFEITDDIERADLVFHFTASSSDDPGLIAIPIGGTIAAIPFRARFTTLSIYQQPKQGDKPLWAITRSTGDGGSKACIKELKKRFPKLGNK